MNEFLEKHEKMITGTISTFDRIIFKGYLPISYPEAAESFFNQRQILLKDFMIFTKTQTDLLKTNAQQIAAHALRPYEYINKHIRKEEYAKKIAERDKITEGLICVLALLEENHSFALRYGEGRPRLQKCSPRCLTLYFYYLDKHFGFMHIRLSTWMPFSIQVYVNGHYWLAQQMTAKNISFQQTENSFISIADCNKAQTIADKFPFEHLENIMHAFARRVNPLLKTFLKGMEYYWVIDQAEYATDVMFHNHNILDELYLNWQKHAAVCTQAEDIMRFMGRKLHGSFNSLIQTDAKYRPNVTRIKHSMRGNWIKMYNKNGIVLRVETVINCPREFRIFRLGSREKAGEWVPMPKRITSLKRYAGISLRANTAYLEALAQADNPSAVYQQLDRLCEPQQLAKQRIRGLNPLRQKDVALFEAVVRGEHLIKGFRVCNIATRMKIIFADDPVIKRRQSAKVNRKLRLLRGHRLIVRIPHTHSYKITAEGMKLMNAAIHLRTTGFPTIMKNAA